MALEWYETGDWDEAAQADFRKRLARAKVHKAYYLKMKASAIADEYPDAGLALCDERIAIGDEDERFDAYYAKSLLYGRSGNIDDLLIWLGKAAGDDERGYAAVAAGEYCCIIAYHGKEELYSRAVKILDALDATAIEQLGRPFFSFPTRAARALLDYKMGHRARAVEPAKDALQLAVEQKNGFMGVAGVGPAPGFLNPLHDALLVIAGLWNDDELGPPPTV